MGQIYQELDANQKFGTGPDSSWGVFADILHAPFVLLFLPAKTIPLPAATFKKIQLSLRLTGEILYFSCKNTAFTPLIP
jgi:hypothetical protein